jgi:hypothetical protein
LKVHRFCRHGDVSPLLRNNRVYAASALELVVVALPATRYPAVNSHGESAQKTTLTGANWEKFWLHWGATRRFFKIFAAMRARMRDRFARGATRVAVIAERRGISIQRQSSSRGLKQAVPSSPRKCGPGTPWLLGSITSVTVYWVARSSEPGDDGVR